MGKTILFAIFGIVGITEWNRISQCIKEDYQKDKSEYETKYRAFRKEQENKYNIHNKKFTDLEIKLEYTNSLHSAL